MRLSRRRNVLLTLLLIVGCQTRPPADLGGAVDLTPVPGDTIVAASIGEPSKLIPLLASDSASGDITGLVYNGLVKYDQEIQLVGDLAESWEILDGGLAILFHLRRGVQWHDGVPFTAEDVKFTYEKLVDPSVQTPYSGDFEQVQSVGVIDPWTVKVTYQESFAPGLASWGIGIIPKHLLEHEDLNTTKYLREPIGTGPYVFKRWKTGSLVELEANPDYFEGRPHIDRYLYRVIPDQGTIFLELQVQQVDETGLTPLQYARMTNTPFFQQTYQRFRYPAQGYTYIGYNLADPKFQDPRVRWAFNYAIDKPKIIDGILWGLGRVTTGPLLPTSWAYNPDVQPAPYDPVRAKALLAEAGWRDTDGDGWLDREGQRFAFTLMTNQGNDQRRLVCEMVQKELATIGVKVTIQIVEWASFIREFVDKRRFEAICLGWGLGFEPDPYDIWHSSKTGEGEFNFISYQNEEVDRLIEEGRRTFDQAKRQAIYQRIHELIYQDQPYTFLYVGEALPVVHRRFHGIELAPIGIGHHFIRWYVPRAFQRYTR